MKGLKASYSFFNPVGEEAEDANDVLPDLEAEQQPLAPSASGQGASPDTLLGRLAARLDAVFALSWAQRMAGFAIGALSGLLMMSLAMMYLPRILIGAPEKFAVCYTLGNILLLVSSCFLMGPSKQLGTMCHSSRAVASVVYVVSMFGTVYAAWKVRSMFVVVPMIGIQSGALIWYVASYFPYGRECVSNAAGFVFSRRLLPI